MDFEDAMRRATIDLRLGVDRSDAFVDYAPPDIMPTRNPTDAQRECAAEGHAWRNGCHCDEGGFICRRCGMHEHYPRASDAQ